MKIKKLTIKNIASIEDATIDFEAEPLDNAGIFLISGRIGAGKSILLDCICLALYGQTPRTSESKGKYDTTDKLSYSDPRRFIRHNANGGSATLVFEADKNVYEAKWEVPPYKQANKDGKLKDLKWTIKNLTTGDVIIKVSETKEFIANIIGLDFEQFCRTTMLAQGEFAQFLKSDDDKKAQILQKITGVDIYQRIGMAISQATSEANRERVRLTDMLKVYTTLSDEERCLIASQLAAYTALHVAYTNSMAKVSSSLQWLKSYDTLTAKYQAANTAHANAITESKTDDVTYSRRLIKVYERTSTLRAQMAERANSLKAIEKAEVEHKRLKVNEADIERRIAELGEGFNLDVARSERDNLKDRQTAIQDADNKCRILTLAHNNVTDNEKNILDAKAIEEKNSPLIDNVDKELKKLEGKLEAYREAAESLRLSAGNEADTLRLAMKPGCKCPVCLQDVELVPSSSHLQDEYDKALERVNNARGQHKAKVVEINRLKAAVEQALKQREECEQKADKLKLQADKARTEAETACSKAKCTIETLPTVINKLPEIDNKITQLDKAIKTGEDIEKENVSLKIKFSVNLAQQTAAKTNIERLTKLINTFIADNQDITEVDIRDASQQNDRSIADLRNKIEKIDLAVVRTQNTLQASTNELSECKSTRPSDLSPQASVAQLTVTYNLHQKKINDLAKHIGRLRQQLDTDAETRKTRTDIEARLLIATNNYDLHARLNTLIGDADGKKFSRIALAHVLGTLIENANVYLKRLTDRYTLRGQTGTYIIMVCDSWHGYTERTVNTTSGGEKFLISLALALALTDIGDVRGTDTLFIDEGFGSLGEEDMNRAIDALASMHKIAGRQVGIISHVAALRDRIPVQIHVDGAPNHPSTITITG